MTRPILGGPRNSSVMAAQPFGNGREPTSAVVAQPLRRGDRGVAGEVEHGDMDKDAKGVVMSAIGQSKELAARQRDGLRVVLSWHPREDAVTVSVADQRTGDRFEIAVERRHALDAFYHPYAYAA